MTIMNEGLIAIMQSQPSTEGTSKCSSTRPSQCIRSGQAICDVGEDERHEKQRRCDDGHVQADGRVPLRRAIVETQVMQDC